MDYGLEFMNFTIPTLSYTMLKVSLRQGIHNISLCPERCTSLRSMSIQCSSPPLLR